MNQAQISLATAYVTRIKNVNKKQYAVAYFNYLRGATLEPKRPVALSSMVAQAVEMSLRKILSE